MSIYIVKNTKIILIFSFYHIAPTNFGQSEVPRTVLDSSGAGLIKTHQDVEL